ncbi:MAG: hypothetical protein E6G51_03520 [Actinobacteria bacterium]|nr:MAG: hypothetical protein E6G51_03520 [Actinomycetota bacterium]
MTRILKSLGLALVAMAALGAMMASGASAQIQATTFNTNTNVHEAATQSVSTIETSVFRIVAGGVPVTCEKETYTGTLTGTDPNPTVKPSYEGCHAIIGGATSSATIETHGCEYKFSATAGSADKFTGTAAIVNCSKEFPSITITTGTGCVVHVDEANNTAVNGVTYENNTATKPTDVTITLNGTNVHSEVTGGLLTCGTSAGTKTNGTFVGKVTVKATNAAKEQIDLTVMNP